MEELPVEQDKPAAQEKPMEEILVEKMLDMLEKESAVEKPDELKPSELDEFKALLQEEKSQDWEDIKEKKSKKKQKKDK